MRDCNCVSILSTKSSKNTLKICVQLQLRKQQPTVLVLVMNSTIILAQLVTIHCRNIIYCNKITLFLLNQIKIQRQTAFHCKRWFIWMNIVLQLLAPLVLCETKCNGNSRQNSAVRQRDRSEYFFVKYTCLLSNFWFIMRIVRTSLIFTFTMGLWWAGLFWQIRMDVSTSEFFCFQMYAFAEIFMVIRLIAIVLQCVDIVSNERMEWVFPCSCSCSFNLSASIDRFKHCS